MLALKYLLITCGVGMIVAAVCILTYDLYREMLYRRSLETPGGAVGAAPVMVRWRTSLALAMLAWGPLLMAFSIVVVPSGMAGVRVSEMSGTVPGTLYPGAHMVMPLVEDVALFDTRDQIFTTGDSEAGKPTAGKALAQEASQLLDVQAKEGLTLGLAITVRYRLDREEAGLHPGKFAASGGEGNRAADSRERVAGDRSELYGARCFFGEAGGSASASSGADHAEAGGGWDCGERGDAAGHPVAGGVCEGLAGAAVEGAGKRPHGRGNGIKEQSKCGSQNWRPRLRRCSK